MEIFKKIARKILADEIKELKERCELAEQRNNEWLDKTSVIKDECESKVALFQSEKNIAEHKAQELKKENQILRQYYDLYKEPSDEIKTKIHIDLEINRLKEENLRLIAMSRPPVYVPQSYPYYGFGYRPY